MRDRLTGGINAAGGSVDAFAGKVDAASRRLRGMGGTADTEFSRMDKASRRLVQSAAAFISVQKGAQLVGNVTSIYKQRQMLESSFSQLLESESKGRKMILDFQKLAMESPIEMTPIANAGQMLLGFGMDAESIMPTMRQLADISMGDQQRFEGLALAFAQCQAAGRLMGQDLLQMVGAGFNPLLYIAEKTGKSIGDLKDEMADGKISAQMVADAFRDATAEGGRFHGMAEKMAAGIRGAEAELATTIVTAYNKFGEQHEEMIVGSYKAATAIVRNYEPILKVLSTLIATYGTYKAAMIATSAYQSAAMQITAGAEAAELAKLMPAQQASKNADIERATAKGLLSQAQATELVAIRAAITAKLEELKSTQALALADTAAASATHKAALQRALSAKTMVAQREMELSIATLSGDTAQIELAQKSLLEAQEERHIAVKARKGTADALAIARGKAAAATTAVETMQTNINTAATVATTKAKNLFAIAGHKAAIAIRSIGAAIKANPLGIALTAIMAITTAVSLFSSKTKEATEDVLGLARAQRNAGEEYDKEAAKVKTLQGIVENGNVAYQERHKALIELVKIIPDYNGQLSKEGQLINNNTDAIKNYLTQLERRIKIKAATDELEAAYREKRTIEKELPGAQERFDAASEPDGNGGRRAKSRKPGDTVGFMMTRGGLNSRNQRLTELNNIIADLNGEIEKTSVAAEGSETPVKTFSEQLATASGNVTKLKGELKDLLAGKGATPDFAKAIEEKKKELDGAQKTLSLLTGVDKSTTKSAKDAGRQKSEIGDREAQIEEYSRKVAEQVAKAELDIEQARIDVMDEGARREAAQIALNHKKLLVENIERRDEMVRELQKAERLAWENANPNHKEQGLVFETTKTEDNLTDDQKRILMEYAEVAKAYRLKADADLLKTSLERYETYEQQRERIAQQAQEEIDFLKSQNTGGGLDGNIARAERERDMAIAALDATMQATADFWGQLFDDFAHYTNAELRHVIDNVQQVLDYVNSTPAADIEAKFGMNAEQLRNLKNNANDIKAVYDALGGKVSQLNARNPLGAIIRSMGDLKKNAKDAERARRELAEAEESGDKTAIKGAKEKIALLRQQEGFLKGNLKDAAGKAVKYFGEVGGSIAQIGAASGSAELESIGKAMGDVSDIANSFMQGGPIAGGIALVTKGLTSIFSSAAKYRAALRQMREDREAFEHEYELTMSQMRLDEKNQGFGENLFDGAIRALSELHINFDRFIKAVNKSDSLGGGSGFWAEAQKRAREIKGITTDLQNIWVQTRNSTWFRSAKGYYLKDKYPELFEGEYGFNAEAARTLLATNSQLNDEAKHQIQRVIDLYDQWKEADEAFNEYLDTTFGSIGSSLGDTIVDAFKNGKNAMYEWGASFSDVLENLGKQLMQTIFFEQKTSALREAITKIYEQFGGDPNRVGKEIQSTLGHFFSNMQGTVAEAEQWYKQWAETAAKYGFNLADTTKQEQQSGKAGVFTTMNQETGTELKGLFTAVQMRSASIDDKLSQVVSLYTAFEHWMEQIATNTGKTADKTEQLLAEVKKIIRDGIKVK